MEWLSVASCADAHRFGWLVGSASGLYALIIATILILTAPAYHPDVPLAVSETTRKGSQWVLWLAHLFLFVAWLFCGWRAYPSSLTCYFPTLCFGAVVVIAPIMLLFMFTSANWVGRASAR
jgi:hypothetical protein